MQWTKAHSRNAVAKKARLRIERAKMPTEDVGEFNVKTRASKPDLIIRIEDRFGQRIKIPIHRISGKVYLTGYISVRQLCRGLEHLITKSA